VAGADVGIAGNPLTEGYVEAILDPEAAKLRSGDGGGDDGDGGYADAIAARAGDVEPELRRRILLARQELVEDGVPVETYRRIGLDEALRRLG
jgi:hypothetical protein